MKVRPGLVEDAAGIARVHVVSWKATYAGMLPDDYLAGLSYERQRSRWEQILGAQNRHSFVLVAERDGRIVGFASGGREREGDAFYTGELYAIYLVPEEQRHGYGRRLVAAVVEGLVAGGHRAMLVWVLAANTPARVFYERLGGRFVGTGWHDLGGISCEEASYGWRELSSLSFAPAR